MIDRFLTVKLCRIIRGYRGAIKLYHVHFVQGTHGSHQVFEYDNFWSTNRFGSYGLRRDLAMVCNYFNRPSVYSADCSVHSNRPLLTLTLLLLLPSFMTIITLVIHRFRQARQERRERAPESVVASLPTGTWSGEGVVFDGEAGVEKDDAGEGGDERAAPVPITEQVEGEGVASTSSSPVPQTALSVSPSIEVPEATDMSPRRRVRLPPSLLRFASSISIATSPSSHSSHPAAAASNPDEGQDSTSAPSVALGPAAQRTRYLRKAWFSSQTECAICLGEFEKGDKLRILPCGHVFHLDEVDVWLVRRKRLVRG